MKTEIIIVDLDPLAGGGVKLRITAEETDIWEGSVMAERVGVAQNNIPVLHCYPKVTKKGTTQKFDLALRLDKKQTDPRLLETVKKWQTAQAEWVTAQENSDAQEKADIESGNCQIQLNYHDGEYLSGYQVHGHASDLLESIELARYISGWGHVVDSETVDALGMSFTFPEAKTFAQPDLEAKAKKEIKKTERHNAIMAKVKKVEIGTCYTRNGSEGDDLLCEVTVTALDGQVYKSTFVNVFDGGLWTPNDWPLEVLESARQSLPYDMKKIRM